MEKNKYEKSIILTGEIKLPSPNIKLYWQEAIDNLMK